MDSELHLNTGFYQFTETERDRERDRERQRQRQRQRQRGTWTLCFVKFSGASKNAVQTVDSLQEVQYIILIIISDYHIKYKIS